MHQVTGSRICPLLSVCMPFATWIVTRGSSSFHRIRDSDQVFPLSRDTVNFTIPPQLSLAVVAAMAAASASAAVL